MMERPETQRASTPVLQAVTVRNSVTSIVLSFIPTVDVDTQATLFSIGLAALAIAVLQNEE